MPTIYTYIILVLSFLIGSFHLQAQDYNNYIINRYQDNNILPHNSTNCILQDNYGFIWIGTDNGLCCFDGQKNIISSLIPQSGYNIENCPILALFEDKENRIWIGTDSGIFIYNRDGNTIKFKKTTKYNVTVSSEIRKIIHNGDKIIITTMGQGFFVYESQHDVLTQYNNYSSFILDAYSSGNTVFLTTLWEGVLKFNTENETLNSFQTNTEDLSKTRFITSGINSLWLGGTNKELFELSPVSEEIKYHKLETNDFTSISSIIPFYDNNFLIGTNNGLYVFNPNNNNVSQFIYSENKENINGLIKDDEGGIWVLTERSGVLHINKRKKNFYNYTIPGNYMVNTFCKGINENTVLLGTQNGLFQYNIENEELKESIFSGISLNYNIISLCHSNNELWIGTESDGVIVIDLTNNKTRHYKYSYNSPNTITGNSIKKIFKSKEGNIIIGTNWGVCYYNKEKDNFKTETTFGAMMTITDIYEDSRNNIWFATNNSGVYKNNLNTRTWKHYQYEAVNDNSLPNNSIIKIYENKEKQLILSTNGNGLCFFDYENESFTTFHKDDEIFSKMVINSVEQDLNGHLWLSTNSGLYYLESFKDTKYTHFTSRDGLERNFYCERASYMTSNGIIMFGGSNGFNLFNPSTFENNNFIPPVYITGINFIKSKDKSEMSQIIKNYNTLYLSKRITIPYSYNSFTIHFSSLSYMDPERNMFSYKMEGIDNNWFNNIKYNSVTYNNLAPGEYCLYIKGSNNDGIWNNNVTKLYITITPPWYMSTLAYCIYILITVFVILYTLIRRDKSIKKRYNLRIKEFQEEKEKELYKNKVNFFINLIHEIRTPLTLIKLPLDNLISKSSIEKENNKYFSIINKNVEYLLGITNELLDFQKMESGEIKLHQELNNINILINEIYQQFIGTAEIKHIEIQNNINNDLTNELLFDKDKISRIIVNLLSNAIKYAKNKIVLSSYIKDNYINIQIEDDGPGIKDEEKEKVFQIFYQSETNMNVIGTGIGLAYSRTLAESHHGELSVQDSDLGGAAFILSLPLYDNVNKAEDNKTAILPDNEYNTEITIQDEDEKLYRNCTVLLVEDNPDLLEMESSNLKKWFKIIKAQNGEQALNIIDNNDVDIIVSDVMMPIMDGMELCKRIKNNIEYSHIPVILLTAKVLPESKVEGFHHGADAYVEKPFTIMQIYMQIRNLLKLRSSLQKRIQPLSNIGQELNDESFISNKDLEFLKMLEENINSQLSNEEFSIDSLASVMNMSRSNFYRKLKALTDMSPNDYLKNCRLNKAAQLLKEGYRITEVYEQTGFCSSSYFAKCFKAKFGVLPKDFQSNKDN